MMKNERAYIKKSKIETWSDDIKVQLIYYINVL